MRSASIALVVLMGVSTAYTDEDKAHQKAVSADAAKNAPALAAAGGHRGIFTLVPVGNIGNIVL